MFSYVKYFDITTSELWVASPFLYSKLCKIIYLNKYFNTMQGNMMLYSILFCVYMCIISGKIEVLKSNNEYMQW